MLLALAPPLVLHNPRALEQRRRRERGAAWQKRAGGHWRAGAQGKNVVAPLTQAARAARGPGRCPSCELCSLAVAVSTVKALRAGYGYGQ